MPGMQRLGLLGGTFDPVHLGHLMVAARVREAFALEAIWFIPASLPPHKRHHGSGQDISPYGERVAMLEIALAGETAFMLSRIEAELPGPSYTVHTLKAIRQRIAPHAALFFIIGSDAFAEIQTWKDFRRLVMLAGFIVITRPDFPFARVDEIVGRHFPDYRYNSSGHLWEPAGEGEAIHFLDLEPIPISSTDIRQRVRSGTSIDGLVPAGVAEYIRAHGLYGPNHISSLSM